MASPIEDVSDTAFWIAYHRALETARSDALFVDPYAARLAGERGRKISEAMPTSRIVAWTVSLRTRIIDDFIAAALQTGVDTVLNLGAGLDARPYRMELPATLHWIEADYPRMIDYKESQLNTEKPRCRLERVRIDLADHRARCALFARVAAEAHAILVLTEGVVPYLSNADAASLADDLTAMRNARFWIVDYFSERAWRQRQRKRIARTMRNAPFKFSPGDWFGFFRQHGWRAKEVRYFVEEAQRLQRPAPFSPLMRFLFTVSQLWMSRERRERWRRSAGYALLEPVSRDAAGE